MKKATESNLASVQPLLFWQTGVLAGTAGLAGTRYPLFCLMVLMLLFWVDSRAWKPASALFLIFAAGGGLGIGLTSDPMLSSLRKQPFPAWLEASLTQRKPVRISGTVRSVQGIPDQRLRIVLENVTPETDASEQPSDRFIATQLPGRLVWTWEYPAFRPLPNQTLTANLSIRPVRGFQNADTSNSDVYWKSKGIFFQAWSRKDQATPILSGTPSLSAQLREKLHKSVLINLPHTDGATLIPALLFGDRFSLTHSITLRFQEAGLSHSLALSGQHLAIAGIIAWLLLKGLGLIAPRCFFHIPAVSIFAALSVPPACFYLWLGDAPPSLVRASLMLVLGTLCLWRGWIQMRATTLFDILLLALASLLILDPMSLYDLGLQLSFIAVAGIALALPILRSLWFSGPFNIHPLELLRTTATPSLRFRAAWSQCLRFFWLILGTSLAAQLATLPLTLNFFGYSTFWFPLNLLWLPILGFLVLPAAFLGLFVAGTALLLPIPLASLMDTFAKNIFLLAVLPCDLLVSGLEWLHRFAGMDVVWGLRPHWTALLGFGAILVAFASCFGRTHLPAFGKRMGIAGLLFLLIGPSLRILDTLSSRIDLRILDVGQGQSVLLEWPPDDSPPCTDTFPIRTPLWERQLSSSFLSESQGLSRERALIDGGGFFSSKFDSGRDVIRPVLTANQHPDLSFVALTHPDRDHLRGLFFLTSHFHPASVFTAPFPEASFSSQGNPSAAAFLNLLEQQAIPRFPLSSGARIHLTDKVTLHAVAPLPGTIPSGNNGLILRLEYEGHGLALLPGDAEAPYIKTLLRTCTSSDIKLDAEVLLLPHHGSAQSLVPTLYDTLHPDLAIASVGAYNSYGLPADAVCNALAQRHIPVYSTSEHGEISLQWVPRKNGLPERSIKTTLP